MRAQCLVDQVVEVTGKFGHVHLHSGVLARLPLYGCALCLVQDGLSILLKDVVRLRLRSAQSSDQQNTTRELSATLGIPLQLWAACRCLLKTQSQKKKGLCQSRGMPRSVELQGFHQTHVRGTRKLLEGERTFRYCRESLCPEYVTEKGNLPGTL